MSVEDLTDSETLRTSLWTCSSRGCSSEMLAIILLDCRSSITLRRRFLCLYALIPTSFISSSVISRTSSRATPSFRKRVSSSWRSCPSRNCCNSVLSRLESPDSGFDCLWISFTGATGFNNSTSCPASKVWLVTSLKALHISWKSLLNCSKCSVTWSVSSLKMLYATSI